ncbi:unnamed protein product, partial [Ectocarpus sp. 13 AM-2016]
KKNGGSGKKKSAASTPPLRLSRLLSTGHQSNIRGVYVTAVIPCLFCWTPVSVTRKYTNESAVCGFGSIFGSNLEQNRNTLPAPL